MGSAAEVVGVDGWRGGWVSAALSSSGKLHAITAYERFTDLVAAYGAASVIGVDMPIGLPETPPRPCDDAARRRLGPRRSSVFPAPPRDVLNAATYAEARSLSTERYGRSISAQSYALRHKIFEVDAIAATDDRVHEIHPELAFAAMAGAPLAHAKRTWSGMAQRRSLLLDQGIVIPEELPGAAARVPADDVLDAVAVAWSARRITHGDAVALPDVPPPGQFGRVIWY